MTEFILEEFLPYRLAELSRAASGHFSQHYRDRYGISVSEWRVVAHLSQQEAVSVREICQRVGMDKPKVSRAASRLEAAGYVSKVENAQDRRLVQLSLTEKGRDMVDTLAPIAAAYHQELIAALGDGAESFLEQVEMLRAYAGNRQDAPAP